MARNIDVVLGPRRKVISKIDSSHVGTLDKKTTDILKTLLDDSGIEIQMQCRVNANNNLIGKSKSGSTQRAALWVIIYGEEFLGEDVGDLCEECHLFLQDPIGCDRIVKYINPHRLSTTDAMTSIESVEVDITLECSSNPVDLLAGFENGEELPEADNPHYLQTPLQK